MANPTQRLRSPISLAIACGATALLLACAACAQMGGDASLEEAPAVPYRVERLRPPDAPDIVETQCWRGEHHFATIVEQRGQCVFRTHPGDDPNGWGSSLFLQPFIGGQEIHGGRVRSAEAEEGGVRVTMGGAAHDPESGVALEHTATMLLVYTPEERRVTCEGEYRVSVSATGGLPGDLNLLRVASNYLVDVPLIGGGAGDTGDMRDVAVTGDGGALAWRPRDGSHFPQETFAGITVAVRGQRNTVDSAAMGFDAIEEAAKPSLQVTLEDETGLPLMRFGAMFDVSVDPEHGISRSKLFWCDNVGVVVLIDGREVPEEQRYRVHIDSTAEAEQGH